MSTASMSSISPIAERDIRSASKAYKRDKDHGAKWANGQRPSSGVHMRFNGTEMELTRASESQKAKFRPEKLHSQM